jgi:dipeptidyl-peptidase-4
MSYEFSSDKNYILMQTQFAKIFRHSFLAEWKIFDVVNNKIINVTISNSDEPFLYRLVKFAPSGHGLIVVHRNNIYYKETPFATEIQITRDGTEELNGAIMNGIPDWVYEEEIFSTNSASWFSPDGKKLAFIQFNDSHVPSMSVPIYGSPGQIGFQYPQTIELNYPKSGAPNPTVKFFYVDLEGITQENVDQKLQNVPAPSELAAEEHLITSVAWASDETLISVWMNRVQNKAIIFKCSSGSCENSKTLESSVGWIEFYTSPFFTGEGSEMIFIGSQEDYRHIKLLNLNTKDLSARTSGKFIVTEILRYIKNENVILYTANLASDIKAQHVYAIKNENGANAICLTCSLHEDYSYYAAEVSEGGHHIVVIANGPGVPRVDLYALKIDGK